MNVYDINAKFPRAKCKACGVWLTFNTHWGRSIFTHPQTDCDASGYIIGSLGLDYIEPEKDNMRVSREETPKERQPFNRSAFHELVAAELVYLQANGWQHNPNELDSWSNYVLGYENIPQGKAVNVQKQRDRTCEAIYPRKLDY